MAKPIPEAAPASAATKSKILYVITQSAFGGAQRYVLDLASHLPPHFEPVIAAGLDGGGGLLEMAQQAGVRTVRLKAMRRALHPRDDVQATAELRQLYACEQPAVIHLNSSKAGVLGSLAARHAYRTLYTVHGWVFREELPVWRRALYVRAERLSAHYLDRIIVLSDSDRQAGLKHGFKAEKIRLIRNGILPPRFQSRDTARRMLSEMCGRNLNHIPLALCIASFYRTKGLCHLIDAMPAVPEPCVVVIVGDGELRAELTGRIAARSLQERVLLPGALADAAQLLPAADVFVLPSVKEGLPYVLLEAMAARVPIVATRVGGIAEVISGALVAPAAPAELAAAIRRQLAAPFIAPEEPLSFAHMLDSTVQCYTELCQLPPKLRC